MPSMETEAAETDAATAAEVDAFMEQEMKKADDAEKLVDVEATTTGTNKPSVPPAVAALDAALAPYMKKPEETTTKNQYIAVRVGYATCPSCISKTKTVGKGACPRRPVTTIRNAIFLSWDDAKDFVEFEKQKEAAASLEGEDEGVKTVPFYSNVEWKSFDRFDKAEVNSLSLFSSLGAILNCLSLYIY
jgi:hypothetical protein